MSVRVPDKGGHFSIFRTAAEEAAETRREDRSPEEVGQASFAEADGRSAALAFGSPSQGIRAPRGVEPAVGTAAEEGPHGPDASTSEAEAAIDELALALYAQDIRLGIVRVPDILNADGALSAAGEEHYLSRAEAILESLAEVSDAEIVEASMAEPANSPRGASARAELIRRGLANV